MIYVFKTQGFIDHNAINNVEGSRFQLATQQTWFFYLSAWSLSLVTVLSAKGKIFIHNM